MSIDQPRELAAGAQPASAQDQEVPILAEKDTTEPGGMFKKSFVVPKGGPILEGCQDIDPPPS